MEQWKLDLQREIRNSRNKTTRSSFKIPKISIRPLLLILTIMLFYVGLTTFEDKRPGYINEAISGTWNIFFGEEEVDPMIEVVEGLDSRLAAIELKSKQNAFRIKEARNNIYLNTVIADENTAISKEILRRYSPESKHFVHIGPDGKINRMPSHINLSAEAEAFLRKRLR